MTKKQRTATAIGAAIGLVLGFVFFGDGDSLLAALPLAVAFAIVAGAIGFILARGQGDRQ